MKNKFFCFALALSINSMCQAKQQSFDPTYPFDSTEDLKEVKDITVFTDHSGNVFLKQDSHFYTVLLIDHHPWCSCFLSPKKVQKPLKIKDTR